MSSLVSNQQRYGQVLALPRVEPGGNHRSLHRQFQHCMLRADAAPFERGSTEFNQLNIFGRDLHRTDAARLSRHAEHCCAFVTTKRTIKKRAEKTPPVMILVT